MSAATQPGAGTAREIAGSVRTEVPVTAGDITLGHTWAADNSIYAIVRLSPNVSITLRSVACAEALIAAATKARDALARLEASAPPSTLEERADYEAWRASKKAASECWCGNAKGHDWAGKADGQPHPGDGV